MRPRFVAAARCPPPSGRRSFDAPANLALGPSLLDLGLASGSGARSRNARSEAIAFAVTAAFAGSSIGPGLVVMVVLAVTGRGARVLRTCRSLTCARCTRTHPVTIAITRACARPLCVLRLVVVVVREIALPIGWQGRVPGGARSIGRVGRFRLGRWAAAAYGNSHGQKR